MIVTMSCIEVGFLQHFFNAFLFLLILYMLLKIEVRLNIQIIKLPNAWHSRKILLK